MSLGHWIGRLLGLENVKSVDQIDPAFAAPWASRSPAWVVLGGIALVALAIVFYYKYQVTARRRARLALAILRGALLALLLCLLAEPVLTLRVTNNPRPLLYVLFDGTDSMGIEDDLPADEGKKLAQAVELRDSAATPDGKGATDKPSRIEYVQALVKRDSNNTLERLAEKYRLRAFLLDRADGVKSLELGKTEDGPLDPAHLAEQLTTEGRVTAVGRGFEDLAERHATGHLAGVIMVSDFAQNSGPAPVGSAAAPVSRLGVPIYTVGVGPASAADLSLTLNVRPLLKKAERDVFTVDLRQSELEGSSAVVRLTARRLTDELGREVNSPATLVDEQTVTLKGAITPVEFKYLPEETGRFEFVAEVDPLDKEVVKENNRSAREASVRDDFLRLFYVAYEPTWEWRFIKEVFHRDKLVGMRGFRTFLRSSDPKVRQGNSLFLPSLTPPRSEFFASDVVFLDDMPAGSLSDRFCETTKELVSKFGAGLVIIAGPRFGPAELSQTPLAEILPVVVDPSARADDREPFKLKLSDGADRFDFMKLGATDEENVKAWENLGPLSWYQPVSRPHPQAEVLAEHPTAKCVDGKTPQPLIAIRQYGNGQVVYMGFNETWRLRKRFGELYYRQYWGQMIYHLGLRHALGAEKRFVVRTDRQRYQPDDVATISVDAYDENFEPLSLEKLPEGHLTAELFRPAAGAAGGKSQTISIPVSRQGLFETRLPVLEPGEHRLRVRDPITRNETEVAFQVTNVSVERQRAVRNVALEKEIALASRGSNYDLVSFANLPNEIKAPSFTETHIKVFPLWSTWLCFGAVVLLMLLEWLIRKWVNLA